MRILLLSLLVAGLSGYLPALSAAGGDMEFRGTLLEPPPCTINSGNNIIVDFGLKVGIKKVDGVNYMQDINYDLVCEPNIHSWVLKLKLTGNNTSFDNAAVQTNINGLGIKILRDGQPFVLGSEITTTPTSKPQLKAVPIQQPGVLLTEGAFEAAATLQADYQ
ncbi:type 1 fimbria pilin [Serratia fonticola]|uniref:Type 1 fimbria pilin n=1 Tax=Serratia fonticola TaxID=47917 RepID=A0A542CY40_SERFO|nr:type 1 fimbria pilin [Serratia fonticola]TQI95738.1 type 1 fimbria pilin [Serratia fonticola]TVZ70233.1 type 1 fimbria pilin [Serratia fonticola]